MSVDAVIEGVRNLGTCWSPNAISLVIGTVTLFFIRTRRLRLEWLKKDGTQVSLFVKSQTDGQRDT